MMTAIALWYCLGFTSAGIVSIVCLIRMGRK